MSVKKAKEVFVRLGGEDLIIPKEDFEINYDYGTDCTYYFIRYEDADGNECEKDGTYLNQNKKMNKEFVTYEEALALKELGYKGDIIGMYDEDKDLFTLHDQDDIEDEWLPAPLYQQAFRWFREVHSLSHMVSDNLEAFVFAAEGAKMFGKLYNSYEEAELACLKELIEIVNQNKDED